MRSKLTLGLAWIGCLAAAMAPAAADEVHLDNGDRLTGTAVRLADGKLVFATAYAGEVSLAWSAVASLETAGPATVVLTDGTTLEGTLASPAPGTLEVAVATLAGPAELSLAEVAAINPVRLPAVRFRGNANVGLVASSGNSETENLFVDGKMVARTEKNRYTFGASLTEAEDDGRTTASRTTVYVEYDQFFSGKWYFNSNVRLTEDELQDLNLRSALGASAGYQVWEGDARTLSFELGVNFVNEDFITAPDQSFPAGRWALDFEHPLWNPEIRLFHRQEGLLGLEDTEDLVIQTETGVRFTVLEKFVAAAQLNLDYDDSPSPGREKEDRTVLFSLGYEW